MSLRNGELCKISFFQAGSETFLALGSKNVTLVTCLRSKELALLDLQTYQEDRYGFAKEMALVFLAARPSSIASIDIPYGFRIGSSPSRRSSGPR